MDCEGFDAMEFCERLKTIRTMRNVTQLEVSEAIGVAPSTYSSYETGAREPSFDVFFKILKYFDISANDLIPPDGDEKVAKTISIKLRDSDREPTPFERQAIEEYVRFIMRKE
jgi:transcriptional regulator with XRE-family HTH domain